MWVEIEFEKYYTISEVAKIFWFKDSTINRKCREWALTCSNVWSKIRPRYIIKGEDILNFLNK